METWKTIPNYPDYEVSDLGRVRSWKTGAPKELSPGRSGPKRNQYLMVNLWSNGRGQPFKIHALVLDAFVGPRPEGLVACHNNGDNFDNRLSNLRWGTPSSNQMDRVSHGTSNRGDRHPLSKLTNSQAEEIRRTYATGATTQRGLAARFGISQSAVSLITTGKVRVYTS